jgi:tetratricopeptide (TPR) repeat protein
MLIATFARIGALALAFALCISPVHAGPAEDTKEAARLYQQGKFDQALARINAVLAQQPKDAQGRFIKGLIFTEQKRQADAIQIFTSLTEDYPELPEPYNNLAVLYAGQGNYDKAKAALELAIHTHPSYATAYENLGDIYAQLARRSYDKVLQLDKGNTSVQGKLAMVKDLFGAPAKATATDPVKVASAGKPESAKQVTKVEPARVEVKAAPAKPETQTVKADSVRTDPVKPVMTGNAEAQVSATVQAWAAAWAGKDVAGYLAFYAPDFETPDNMARAAWEAQRKERIERPKSITVEVKISKVTVKGDEATATFRQTYRSDTTKSDNSKLLNLVKSGDRWLIRSERAGAK